MIKKFSPSLVKLTKLLDDGDYHDGTTLGKKLNMTRSAVWKLMKRLEDYGIAIDSIKGKGYAILEPLILLDPVAIKKKLNQRMKIEVFEKVDSTNLQIKKIKASKMNTVYLAEQQTHGKGRLNRSWHSPFGKNIYLSCHYSFQKDMSELSGLSLVTGLAILKTLKNYLFDPKLAVKWPNDILYGNKKMSGTLIEIQAETHGFSYAIIGIGINVNMLDTDTSISQAWTSLRKILNSPIDRNDLCVGLINQLVLYLDQFNTLGFSPFMDEWIRSDCLTDRVITLKNGNEEITGKVTGVNEQGHLMLRLKGGAIRAFSSGDTSIMKGVG